MAMVYSKYFICFFFAAAIGCAYFLFVKVASASPSTRDLSVSFERSQPLYGGAGAAPLLIDMDLARIEGDASWVEAALTADLSLDLAATFSEALPVDAAQSWGLTLAAERLSGNFIAAAGLTAALEVAFVEPEAFSPEPLFFASALLRGNEQLRSGIADIFADNARAISYRSAPALTTVKTAVDGTLAIEHAATFVPGTLAGRVVATHESGAMRETPFDFADLAAESDIVGDLDLSRSLSLDLSLPGTWTLDVEELSLAVAYESQLSLRAEDLAAGYGVPEPLFPPQPDGCGDFGTNEDNVTIAFGVPISTCREEDERRFTGSVTIALAAGTLDLVTGDHTLGSILVSPANDTPDPGTIPDEPSGTPIPEPGAYILLAAGLGFWWQRCRRDAVELIGESSNQLFDTLIEWEALLKDCDVYCGTYPAPSNDHYAPKHEEGATLKGGS